MGSSFGCNVVYAAALSLGCAVFPRGHPHSVTTGANWTCAPSGSPVAQHMRIWLAGYTAPTSAKADSARVRLALPRAPAESLVVVSDSAICHRAGLAYAREHGQHLPPGSYAMAVIRASNRYIVRGVTSPESAGEWVINSVFDDEFRLIRSILGS